MIGRSTPGEERRRHERHPVMTNVYLSSASKEKKSVKILILDISEMGMKIQIDEKLEHNEEITLGIVGEDVIYKAICLVKHVEPAQDGKTESFKVGTQLTGIHQDLRTR
ncbi:MAG: PilZ domain-containing protein [Proteobacteria bacterium]|nr:PilZ domain-containing protein [Pseudomonadota bacterium]